jgi:uncharacterized protein
MKKLICGLAMLLVASFSHAAPASNESIETLLTFLRFESQAEATYHKAENIMKRTMQEFMEQELKGKLPGPVHQRMLDSLPAKLSVFVRDEMSWAKVKPMYLQIFRDTFEQVDIDVLITFYGSPTGQTFVKKMPFVMQESRYVMMTHTETIRLKMKDIVEQAIAEAKEAK